MMDTTKRKENIIKEHRLKLIKRSDIANEVSRLKSKRRSLRDANAIKTLGSVLKKAKKKVLDVKRITALNKKPLTLQKTSEYKLLFVVRNRRRAEYAESLSVLQSLGLSQMGTGRFFHNSDTNMKMLSVVLPFIYYGTPTVMSIKGLLHKRGTIMMPNGEPKLITTNIAVEEYFESCNAVCIADIVQHIYNKSEFTEGILSKLGALDVNDIDFDEPLRSGDIGTSINDKLERLI